MSDLSSLVPPVPVGPVVKPAAAPRREFYRVHDVFTMPKTGKMFARGDALKGADALAFELAVAAGELSANLASAAPNHLGE